jgi:uncharacterized protein (DUF1778 family)
MKTKMGRPKLAAKNRRGILIQARVSPEEDRTIQAAISKSPHSRSEWIRTALLAAAKENDLVSS